MRENHACSFGGSSDGIQSTVPTPIIGTNASLAIATIQKTVFDRWPIEAPFQDGKANWDACEKRVGNLWPNLGCRNLGCYLLGATTAAAMRPPPNCKAAEVLPRCRGKPKHAQRWYTCSRFVRQTCHEFADHARRWSGRSKVCNGDLRGSGQRRNSAMRAVVSKWNRILFRTWKYRVPYDKNRHVPSLTARNSPLAKQLAGNLR